MIIKSRMKQLKEAGEDGVKYEKFTDVKMRVLNEASQKFG